MKKLMICFAMLLTLASISMAADATLPKPDAVSEETIYLTEKLSKNYDTLVIKEFSTDGVVYDNVNDEEKTVILQMIPELKTSIYKTLINKLQEKKIFKNASIGNATKNERTVILEGSFSEFNAGNRALKFLIGFGAGKAYIKFKGRLLDASTGKELAIFEDRETGYLGSMTMSSFDTVFPHQAVGIGENISKFLEALY